MQYFIEVRRHRLIILLLSLGISTNCICQEQPSALVIVPRDQALEMVLPKLGPVLENSLEDLGTLKVTPKTRRIEYPLSKILAAHKDAALEKINKYSSDPERAAEILNELLGYRLVITFEFEIDPRFRESSITVTPQASASELLKVEANAKLQPKFRPTKVNIVLENPALDSVQDPSTKEMVSVLKNPLSILEPISKFELPPIQVKVPFGATENFENAAKDPEHVDPILLQAKKVETNLREIEIDPDQAERIVATALSKKENIDDVIQAVLNTRVAHDALEQFQKDVEVYLKKQRPKLTMWISRENVPEAERTKEDPEDHHYEFHLAPSGDDPRLKKSQAEGNVIFQAEAEIPMQGVHDIALKAELSGIEAQLQLPENMTLEFVPSIFQINESVLRDMKDPRVSKLFQAAANKNLLKPGMRISLDLQLTETNASARIPLKWDGKKKAYGVDLDRFDVQLPFLNRPRRSIKAVRFQASDKSPELVLSPRSGKDLESQVFDQLKVLRLNVAELLGPQVFTEAEMVLQSEIEKSISKLQDKKVEGEMTVSITDFKFPNPHSLKIDWEDKSTDAEHLRAASRIGVIPVSGEFERPFNYRSLRDFLPTPYLRFGMPKNQYKNSAVFGKSTVLEEKWITVQMPPDFSFQLNKIKAPDSEARISYAKIRMRSTTKTGPTLHVKVRVMRDWMGYTENEVIDFDKENFAAVWDSYRVGTQEGDIELGGIDPGGYTGKATAIAEGLSLVFWNNGGSKVFNKIESYKDGEARKKLIAQIERKKPTIYELGTIQILEALNGSLRPTLTVPAEFKTRLDSDPPYDPTKTGVFVEVQRSLSNFFTDLLKQIPRGRELQIAVEQKAQKVVTDSVLQTPNSDAVDGWPTFVTQKFMDSWPQKVKQLATDWIRTGISSNADYFEAALQELAEDQIPKMQKQMKDKMWSISQMLPPKKSTPQNFSVPKPEVCIYPNPSDKLKNLQDDIFAIGVFADGSVPPALNPAQFNYGFAECVGSKCTGDKTQIFIPLSTANRWLEENINALSKMAAEKLRFKIRKDGTRQMRKGINDTNEFGLLDQPTISYENRELHMRTSFYIDQDGFMSLPDIRTGEVKTHWIFGLDAKNVYDENHKVVGYRITLQGKSVELERDNRLKPIKTVFLFDQLKKEMETMKTDFVIPAVELEGQAVELESFEIVPRYSSEVLQAMVPDGHEATFVLTLKKLPKNGPLTVRASYDPSGHASIQKP